MGDTEALDCRASKIARARDLRRDGKVHREIADALGICAATASLWTRGVLPHGRPPTDPRKAEVLPLLERLYREGRSIPEIARITGVPQPTLFDWRRELGLPRNRRTVYVTDELREGGAVRMAIGPFFSNTNQVREFPAGSEYPVAA
jgi:hypothetical protein